MKRITFLAVKDPIASSIIGPMDLLKSAGMFRQEMHAFHAFPEVTVELVTYDGNPVTCSSSLQLTPQTTLEKIDQTDLIFISSTGGLMENIRETYQAVIPWLVHHYHQGAQICAVCRGSFLLAETGLLDGKTATTHWAAAGSFREHYPNIDFKPERLITDEGRLYCSGGGLSSLDMTYYLIEKNFGHEVAVRCSKMMVMDKVRDTQLPYTIFEGQKNHSDQAILHVQEWLEQNYAQRFQMDDLSSQHGMSSRTFKRRFKKATGDTPLTYLQRLRIDRAKRSLDQGGKTIEEICYQIGYENPRFFRSLFKKYTGISPSAYRKKFDSGVAFLMGSNGV